MIQEVGTIIVAAVESSFTSGSSWARLITKNTILGVCTTESSVATRFKFGVQLTVVVKGIHACLVSLKLADEFEVIAVFLVRERAARVAHVGSHWTLSVYCRTLAVGRVTTAFSISALVVRSAWATIAGIVEVLSAVGIKTVKTTVVTIGALAVGWTWSLGR